MRLIDEVRAKNTLPRPERARAIRERAEVSQARLAIELGVSRMTVCRWERGTRQPRGHHLIAYATLLHELEEAA